MTPATGARVEAEPRPDLPPQVGRFLHAEWVWAGYGVVLTAVIANGAFLRFCLPQAPFIDHDVWGYLQPAFSALQHQGFPHTQGRNFLYPAFLWAVLRVVGDYRAISVTQHALGLLTGGLLAAAWHVWCGLLVADRRIKTCARFLGLLLAADFLWSRWPLLFENSIRPEAVFALFLAASLLLNSGALHARFTLPRPSLERWCLGANVFVTVAAQSLKPSFGFALVVANLPLLHFLMRRAVPWRAKLVTIGSAATVTGLLLLLPEHLLKRGDRVAETFLPETLFTIHAVPIHEQITQDLREGKSGPYDTQLLAGFNQNLERTLADALLPENRPWRVLGINADQLLYKDPVFARFFPPEQPEQVTQFCYYYYRRTWWHRPGKMLGKISRQLASVYPLHLGLDLGWDLRPDFHRKHWVRWFFQGQLPTVFARRFDTPLSLGYQEAWVTSHTRRSYQALTSTPPSQQYLDQLSALQQTTLQVSDPSWVGYVNEILGKTRLPLAGVALLAGAVLWWRQGRRSEPFLAGMVLVFGVNFAMFLTVAVVHSLDADRYVNTQLLLTQWSGFSAVLLVGSLPAILLTKAEAGPREMPSSPC